MYSSGSTANPSALAPSAGGPLRCHAGVVSSDPALIAQLLAWAHEADLCARYLHSALEAVEDCMAALLKATCESWAGTASERYHSRLAEEVTQCSRLKQDLYFAPHPYNTFAATCREQARLEQMRSLGLG